MPFLKIIRAIDCRTTPWKNGCGTTTEIAAEPSGASLDAFDWRVSMAQVGTDGWFSEFPGIDRTLVVVEGSGLVLTIGSNVPVTLERGYPISFAGEVPTSARLSAGGITDLNVMTRRRRFSHRLQRIRGTASCDFDGNDIALVISLNGNATLTTKRDTSMLEHRDAAILLRAHDGCSQIAPIGASDCYLVLLREQWA